MQAVIYTRVSTTEQTTNLSLPTQRKACEDFCRREGWEVAQVFVEQGESAKTADRTELRKLLAYCREHRKTVGIVVVYNLSRFSRNVGDHHALRAMLAGMGIVLKSATEPINDDPAGRFMETIFSAVAQLDNDVKAERTRAGMKAALELGRWTWQPPLGFARGERGGPSMVPDPAPVEAVRGAFSDFASGMAAPEVLKRLKAQCGARRGGVHTLKSLARMLRNPLYVGRVEMPRWGIARLGDFEPLVEQRTFDAVQVRLNGRAGRKVAHAKDHPDFPLRRFMRCGCCEGQGLTGGWTRGRSGRYGYYQCRRCGLRVSKGDLEAAFVRLLDRLQPRREYVKLFCAVVLDVWRKREGGACADRARVEQRIAGYRAKLDRLADLLADGALDAADYQRQRDRLREQVAAAETELERATVEHFDVDAVLAFAEHALTHAARMWEHASPDHKRRLQAVFFPSGLAWEASGEIRTPATPSAFSELRALASPRGHLASPTGFEPVPPP
jgi:site-specific DNA recombinase